MRIFIAVDIPPELKEGLRKLQKGLRAMPLRFVPPEDIHLTLKFLGEVGEERLGALKERLTEVKFSPIGMQTPKYGTFAHVFWLGIKPSSELMHLQQKIEKACLPFAPRDPKGFKPHLTIARFRDEHLSHALRERFRGKSLDVSWKVESFTLYESRLTTEGAVYAELARFSS